MTVVGLFAVLTSLLISQVVCVPAKHHEPAELGHSAARVVNGEPVTNKNDFPFVVDLSSHEVAISSSRFCTGTLVKPNVVLTAAHCVLNDGYSTPVFATVGRIELDDEHEDNLEAETFRTIASIVHPGYAGLGSPNDVALLLLNGSSSGSPVSLASATPKENMKTWVVGYGIQKIGTLEEAGQSVEIMSGRLQKTALRIRDKSFCDIPGAGLRTQDGMLCTEGIQQGSSACKGDSGGGLFLQQKDSATGKTKQVGVVSYGDSQCMSEDSGVFTDVASCKDWVESSTARLNNAFHPAEIQLDDHSESSLVRQGLGATTERKYSFLLPGSKRYEAVKFYRIRTNFKKKMKVKVSLCNAPGSSVARLVMTNDVNVRVSSENKSCHGRGGSILSFASKQDIHVVGVSTKEPAAIHLEISSEVL